MKFFYFRSTVGRKMLMSVMGIALILFLLIHLAGNLLLYFGKDIFNLYSHKLISNPLIYLLEVMLVSWFGVHIYEGIRLTFLSKKARKQPYTVRKTLGRSTLFSSHMFLSGSVIFIFLVIHIKSFKYGPYRSYSVDGTTIRDLYSVVVEHFQMPWYAILYVVAILLLTAHLVHGCLSVPKTLGIYSKRMKRIFNSIGICISLLIGIGFGSIPLYFLIFYG